MNNQESRNPIEKSLSNVSLIGQITGLQCFSVDAESLQPTSGPSRKHKIILFSNLTILMVEVILMTYDVYHRHTTQEHSGVRTGQVITMIVYLFFIVLASVSTMNNLLLRGKAKQIFRNCIGISETLSLLNQSADYRSFEREFRRMLARLFLGWILSNISFMVVIYCYLSRHMLLSGVVAVYAYLLITVMVSYWTLLIRLIGENLKFLRDCLHHLHKKRKLFGSHPETLNSDLRIRRTQEIYNYMGKLRNIYALVHDSTSLFNELMGIPICVFMVSLVMSTISGGYKIFLAICGEAPIVAIVVPLCTMYTYSVALVTLVFSCSSAYNIVNEILRQLHKFEFDKLERDASLSTITLEFACQIDQRPIEFKVGGFHCLTQPLLTTITTGVFTYVMLLVQFHTPTPK